MNAMMILIISFPFPDTLLVRERPGCYTVYSHYVPDSVVVIDYGQNNGSNHSELLASRPTDFLINDDDYPNSGAQQYFSDAAADGQGNFWVVWDDTRNGEYDIYLSRCDASGNPLGPNVRANDDRGIDLQRWPAVSANSSGAIVAWYTSAAPFGLAFSPGNVYYQRFDLSGNKIGTAARVNEIANSASGEYANPVDIAVNDDGEFIIAWVDLQNVWTYNYDIYSQKFDEQGNPVGQNIRVNDDLANIQQKLPACAIDNTGKFIIVWQDGRFGIGNMKIFAQGFDEVGQPLGTNFMVNADNGFQPQVCMVALSTAVVIWSGTMTPIPYDPWFIVARKFDISGIPITDPVQVSETAGNNRHSNCAANANGYVAVTWWGYDDPYFNLYSQRLNPDLTWIGNNLQINSTNLSIFGDVIPGIAFSTLTDRVLYVWSDEREEPVWDTYASIFNFTSGAPITDNYRVNDDQGAMNQATSDITGGGPSVNASCSDRHVVVWIDPRDDFYFHIYAQLYDGDGNALGSNFLVCEEGHYATNPSVAMTTNGDFIVVFEDAATGYDHFYARRFNRDGVPYGPSFQVDDTPPLWRNRCWYPAVDCDEEGKFVIVWEDQRFESGTPTNDPLLIGLQCYDSDGVPVGSNILLGLGPDANEYGNLYHPGVAINDANTILICCQGSILGDGQYDIHCWYRDFYQSTPQLEPIIINDNTEKWQQKPVIASEGEDFLIVWLDDYDGDWHYDIYGQKVDSDGTPDGENFQINERTNPYHYFEWPALCTSLSGGYIVTWADNSEPDWNVYAQGMDDAGALIGNCLRINSINEPFEYCHQIDPGVSSNEKDVFFVWEDNRRQKGFDIYGNFLPRSSFWITDDPLSLAYNGNRHLVRKPTSTDLHMVYTDLGNVLYRNSFDDGSNWSASEIIGGGKFPSITLDPDNLPSVTWTDDNGGLWYAKQTVFGTWDCFHLYDPWNYWQARVNAPPSITTTSSAQGDTVHILATLENQYTRAIGGVAEYAFPIGNPTQGQFVFIEGGSSPNYKFCYNPSITKDYQNMLHAVWQRGDTICYATRIAGQTWYNFGPLFGAYGRQSAYPFVETYGDSVWIVWQYKDPVYDKEEVQRGRKWIPFPRWVRTPLSSTPNTVSLYPVNASGLATTFVDEQTSPLNDWYEIYWKRIPEDPLNNISQTENIKSIYPQTSLRFNQIADNELYVVWQEGNAAPYKIDFKKVYVPDLPHAFFTSGSGDSLPSPYLVDRDTFFNNWAIPVDAGYDSVAYRFYLEPGYFYKLKAIAYHQNGKAWKGRIRIDNLPEVQITYNAQKPETLAVWVPPALYTDSVVNVTFKKVDGSFAALGPIYIYRYEDEQGDGGSGGPMSQLSSVLTNFALRLFPNPFTDKLRINLSVHKDTKVKIDVYDISGRLVKQLYDGSTSNALSLQWNGDDTNGKAIPQGIYFLQVQGFDTGKSMCVKVIKLR